LPYTLGGMAIAATRIVQRLVPDLIKRAAEMLGGFTSLADHLDVPEHSLQFWAARRASAPSRVVTALVDLVLRDDIARAKEDRRHHARGVARTIPALDNSALAH